MTAATVTVIGWLLLAAPQPATSGLSESQRTELLSQGQSAFETGLSLSRQDPDRARTAFLQSAAAFQSLADAGVRNGRLYYNLGNAYLKSGKTGRAIAAYRRAQSLIPGNPRLQSNLDYARSLCRYEIPPTGARTVARTVLFWHYETSARSRFLAGLAAYVLFWACLIGRTWAPRLRWRYPAAVLMLIWISLGVSVVADAHAASGPGHGVVIADEVVVRKGDGQAYEPQFEQPLVEGVEFEVIERRHDWIHIRLADGQEGWVPLDQAELI